MISIANTGLYNSNISTTGRVIRIRPSILVEGTLDLLVENGPILHDYQIVRENDVPYPDSEYICGCELQDGTSVLLFKLN